MPHLVAAGCGVAFVLALGWFYSAVFGYYQQHRLPRRLLERARYARADLVIAAMFHWSVGLALIGAVVGSLIGLTMPDIPRVLGSIAAATVLASLVGTVIGLIQGLLG